MMRSALYRWVVAVSSGALFSCGGSQASEPPDVMASDIGGSGQANRVPAASPESPWDGATIERLAEIVRTEARERIREAQPGLDMNNVDGWLERPEIAPELNGKTVERFFDLAKVALAEGHPDRAAKFVRLIRARAKNRNSAFAGTTLLAEASRRLAGSDVSAQEAAVAEVFRELPRARFGAATVIFMIYQTQEQLDAQVAELRTQLLGLDTASTALFFGYVLPDIVRNRELYLRAIETVRAENAARPADRDYAFSTVDLTRASDARPVNVAVWDTGTNTELFASQLYANPREQLNRRDDDGNSLADDIHGLVDTNEPHTVLLYDPGAEVVARYGPFLRGVMDLRAGMASTPSAQRVLELQRGIATADGLVELERNLDAVSEWAHGTHVAGIMLAGNPQARLAVFRSVWAGETRVYFHRGPTDQELDGERVNVDNIARFIRNNKIRVVNASLGFSQEYVEEQLGYQSDLYPTTHAVRARATAIHARRRSNWEAVFDACPDTLFVVSAGNSNQDVVEYGHVPASIERPNVIPVGAVDRFGNWATFTNSNAERVRIFDHGVEVESLIPSGERVPLSGTSMAAPNVSNLAAKMISVDPCLSPIDAARIIVETGDPIAEPFHGRIANEARALVAVRRSRGAPRRVSRDGTAVCPSVSP